MDEQNTSNIQTEATEQWEPDELMNPRPKWPKVIGVISILYGVFGLTCGGIGLATAPIITGLMKTPLEGDPIPYGMVMHAVDYIIGGLGIALAASLLMGGITAVTHRPVTRTLHLVYAIGVLPLSVWSYLNQVGKQELNLQWAEEFPNNTIAQGMNGQNPGQAIGELVGLVLFILLGIGVPVFYLIWFGLIKTKPEQITGDEEGIY